MVAYSFKRQFVAPIRAGIKAQTIRAHRRRHARPGEAVQLYTGMRTRACERIVPDVRCRDVVDVLMDLWPDDRDEAIRVGDVFLERAAREQFAIQDGFDDLAAMRAFWLQNHGREPFRGVLITWEPFA